MGKIEQIKRSWKEVKTEQILIFGGMFAGLFLLYVSSLNIYFGTPVSGDELRFTQGLVGLSFIFTSVVLLLKKKS